MKTKYLGVILIFLIMITAVNAADEINYSNKDMKIQLHGFNFTIPEGYGPMEDETVNKTEFGVHSEGLFYANSNEEVIMVSVIYGDEINQNLDEYAQGKDYEKITVKGHEGVLFEDGGYKFFTYLDGNNVFVLQAHSDDLFEKIIS